MTAPPPGGGHFGQLGGYPGDPPAAGAAGQRCGNPPGGYLRGAPDHRAGDGLEGGRRAGPGPHQLQPARHRRGDRLRLVPDPRDGGHSLFDQIPLGGGQQLFGRPAQPGGGCDPERGPPAAAGGARDAPAPRAHPPDGPGRRGGGGHFPAGAGFLHPPADGGPAGRQPGGAGAGPPGDRERALPALGRAAARRAKNPAGRRPICWRCRP